MSRYRYIYNKVMRLKGDEFWREQVMHYGNKNKNKVFYVIRRADYTAGLFSLYTYVLGHINYAIRNNWLPIIDLENYDNAYSFGTSRGTVNAWELFFKQPIEYPLSEVYKSKNVVLSTGGIVNPMPNISSDFLTSEDRIIYWRDLANTYIPLKEEIRTKINTEYERLVEQNNVTNNRVLGVLLRGTDYVKLRPKNHPKQPTVSEAVECINAITKKYNLEYIYVTTEDDGILNELKKIFGYKLLYCDVKRYSHDVGAKLYKYNPRSGYSPYELGLNYIIPLGVLAQCPFLFAGRTSGSVGALLIGEKFNYKYFWDKGLY